MTIKPNTLNTKDRIYRSVLLVASPTEKVDILFYRVRDQITIMTTFTIDWEAGESQNTLKRVFSSWQTAFTHLEGQLLALPSRFILVEDAKGKYYDSGKYTRAMLFLEDVARRREVITYMELEVEAGIHRNNESAEVLDKLSHRSFQNAEHYLISSLVVSKATGVPGEGYYTMCRNLGLIVPDSEEERLVFWESQLNKVWNAFK